MDSCDGRISKLCPNIQFLFGSGEGSGRIGRLANESSDIVGLVGSLPILPVMLSDRFVFSLLLSTKARFSGWIPSIDKARLGVVRPRSK